MKITPQMYLGVCSGHNQCHAELVAALLASGNDYFQHRVHTPKYGRSPLIFIVNDNVLGKGIAHGVLGYCTFLCRASALHFPCNFLQNHFQPFTSAPNRVAGFLQHSLRLACPVARVPLPPLVGLERKSNCEVHPSVRIGLS